MPRGRAVSDMRIYVRQKTWNDVPLILDVTQVAVLLNLHPNTVTRLCRTGQLKSHKFGKEWRIAKEAVQEIMGLKEK